MVSSIVKQTVRCLQQLPIHSCPQPATGSICWQLHMQHTRHDGLHRQMLVSVDVGGHAKDNKLASDWSIAVTFMEPRQIPNFSLALR